MSHKSNPTEPNVTINISGEEKRGRIWRNAEFYGKEYCHSTSIHGFRYLGEGRTLFEKVWWILVLISSFTGCIILIYKTYKKWESSPIIVTFATKETPLYEIPFPAVTICPQTKIKQNIYNHTKLTQMIKQNMTLGDEDSKIFQYISWICNNDEYDIYDNVTWNFVFDDFGKFLKTGSPNIFTENLQFCEYIGISHPCNDIFTPILIDEGLCYTFNILDRTEFFTDIVEHYEDYHNVSKETLDWNRETLLYRGNEHVFSYPYRALLAGAKVSLAAMFVTLEENIDYLCSESLQGYKVLLHHPATIPRLRNQYFTVSLDQSVFVAIEPVMVTTSENLVNYKPKIRGCYFANERQLKFFHSYTEQNCELECLTNFTMELCKCVAFFMPRENGTNLCHTDRYWCTEYAELVLLSAGLLSKFQHKDKKMISFMDDIRNMSRRFDCDCLPACTAIDYKIEISQTNWNWEKIFNEIDINFTAEDQELKDKRKHFSRLELFFKTNQIIALERNELYGPTDFLANFGGILGLFTGFSLISLIEILYFLTLRVMCNVRLRRRRNNYLHRD